MDIEVLDEVELKADTSHAFKERIGPFVEKYCVKGYGSRPKSGIKI
jgi:hypothetical protein